MMSAVQEQVKNNTETQRELDVALAEFMKNEQRADELSNVKCLLFY